MKTHAYQPWNNIAVMSGEFLTKPLWRIQIYLLITRPYFLQNIPEKCSITCLWGWGMGMTFVHYSLTCIPVLSMSYHIDGLIQKRCNSIANAPELHFLPVSPPGWRGIVVTVRAGGCQTCGTHISVTAWRIFSIRSSVELPRPVGVHCHGHIPICPIWACPWAKNLSNLPQIGSRLCRTHISETAGWIYPI